MTDERWKECTSHHHGCACREHEWEERVATLKAELELVKSNYEYLKGDWNKTCELAKEHCPCPLGTSHITDGIPRLAERAKRLEAEVERLKAHTWQQERAAIVKWLWTGRDGYYAEAIDRGEHWPEGGEDEKLP